MPYPYKCREISKAKMAVVATDSCNGLLIEDVFLFIFISFLSRNNFKMIGTYTNRYPRQVLKQLFLFSSIFKNFLKRSVGQLYFLHIHHNMIQLPYFSIHNDSYLKTWLHWFATELQPKQTLATNHQMRRTIGACAKRIAEHLSTKWINNHIPITVNRKKARVTVCDSWINMRGFDSRMRNSSISFSNSSLMLSSNCYTCIICHGSFYSTYMIKD